MGAAGHAFFCHFSQEADKLSLPITTWGEGTFHPPRSPGTKNEAIYPKFPLHTYPDP